MWNADSRRQTAPKTEDNKLARSLRQAERTPHKHVIEIERREIAPVLPNETA